MNQKQFLKLFAMGVICSLLMIPISSFAATNSYFTGQWNFHVNSQCGREQEMLLHYGYFILPDRSACFVLANAITLIN